MVTVNGKCYDWSDLNVKTDVGDLILQSIDYGDELEKELVYGQGNLPRGYGRGNYKASCKISMLLDDFTELEKACKQKNVPLYNLQIKKIVCAYANPGSRPDVDEISNCSITKIDNKAAQGDKSLTVDIELLVAGVVIRNGVKPV